MTEFKLVKDLCSQGLMCPKPGRYGQHHSHHGPMIKKENHEEVVKGTLKAEDTKRWGSKRDDQKLEEKNLELREEILQLM
ncbi:uncharacterized protein G2W53_041962 [Senna tora]|uniref:Uncharacterized protein n=1 Tax=Senna tora TaxID=362788 RepID=A0A834W1X4_9FABA|nr:uncharacterized protein G2W53_041962 [Senna tora]